MRSVNLLETPIEYLKGVGPVKANVLKKELGIFTFNDLLNYFPFRYVDKSKFYNVSEIASDSAYVQLKGKISKIQVSGSPRASRATAYLEDNTGRIELIWFRGAKWIVDKIKPDVEYVIFGKPALFNRKFNMPHPELEAFDEHKDGLNDKLQPFYNSTEKLKAKGLTSKGIGKIMRNLILVVKDVLCESLSEDLIVKFKLISRKEAYQNIHFPNSATILRRAQSRLKFEEFFFIQLNLIKLKLIRAEKISGFKFPIVGEHFNEFYHKYLPFELTGAQKKVIKEIRIDIGSGKQMNRLLQGDVGSGKTLVALMVMLIAIDNGFQAAIMAPTEILAQQHLKSVSKMLGESNLNIRLLTGSTKTAERKEIHQLLLEGSLNIIIGTHALIEDKVKFKNLGLVVIDEQHRFGVAQRAKLWKKNIIPPHILVMTATPIPRTLAMTFYGDLDLSIIDELPPGRKPVKTIHDYDSGRLKVFGFMRKQIEAGRQVYVVYPLINESEKLDLKDLMDGFNSITREFPLPQYAVSIVHGKMNSQDKDYEMKRFVEGETQIMVSTTVIEVGVDVPNASVMVIENAERFGLSQLHQLRGRVGRGADQSYCVLMTKDKLSNEAKQRISTMVRTTDGFEIAEADLNLRGPGDMHGTQQSGLLDLKIADIVKDEKILRFARDAAAEILHEDHNMELDKNKMIREHLKTLNLNQPNWSLIS